jgi:hypothetical protein
MTPDRIRQLLNTQPFQPFTVYTGDGSSVDVLSSEFAWLMPGGRTMIVSVPIMENATEENEFRVHNIDVFLVTKIATHPKRGRRNGRRRAG